MNVSRTRGRRGHVVCAAARHSVERLEARTLLSSSLLSVAPLVHFPQGNYPSAVASDAGGNLFGTALGGAAGDGVIFELARGSHGITVVASFDGADGLNPQAGVTFDGGGNLFGTTYGGGAHDDGTVFEIAKGTRAITTLASFNGGDGSGPEAGLTFDPQGNLFGTTSAGGSGTDGSGTVFEIARGSRTITAIATFDSRNGYAPPSGVTLDAAGNLFGTVPNGGANGNGAVFEVARGSRTITTLASFGAADGSYPSAGVTVDSTGNLYGTTYGGGAHDVGTVFEIGKGGRGYGTLTTLASFDGTNGSNPSAPLTLDPAGNLYGTTQFGGIYGRDASGFGTIFEVPKGSHAINKIVSFNGADGANPTAAVSLDAAGNLFGSTAGNNGMIFEIAKGSRGYGPLATVATFDDFNGFNPVAPVTFDSAGNLFGTTLYGGAYGYPGGIEDDPAGGTVFEIPMGGRGYGTLTTVASFGGAFNDADGIDPSAGVTFDAAGNLFGTTAGGGAGGKGTVFEIAKGSHAITTVASFDGTNGAYPAAAVTFDSRGNLFGTTPGGGAGATDGDGGNGTVFEIAKGSHAITTVASFGGASAVNATAGADPLAAVVFDSGGNLFGTTSEGGAHGDGTVFEIARGSRAVTTLASFDGADGANPAAGVTLDSAGNLYGTAESGGALGKGTVFEVARGSRSITTLADFDGVSGAAPLSAVTFNARGNLFGTASAGGIYDTANGGDGTIFEIARGSRALTKIVSFNGADGSGPSAAVTFDAAGNLYGTTPRGGASGDGMIFEIKGLV